MNPALAADRRRLRFKGLVLLLVLLGLVAFSVATYNKVFTPVVRVDVSAARAGLQLNKNGDVRLKGALVGRIASVRREGDRAVIGLALDKDAAAGIPADSRVRILPTTLFGQKYVELVRPDRTRVRAVRNGDVLRVDKGAVAIEIGALLDRLEPVLTAVRPHDLSMTLEALATGLEGRGEQIGRLAVDTRALLAEFDEHLPQLVTDLRLLADVSTTYADLTPDLLRMLRNIDVTSATVTEKKLAIAVLLRDVTDFADLGEDFLDRNAPGLAAIVRDTRPFNEMLARYSPEFRCLFAGLLLAEKATVETFKGGIFKLRMVLGSQAEGYTAKDHPVLGNAGRGPDCAGLPVVTGAVPSFGSSHDGVGPDARTLRWRAGS